MARKTQNHIYIPEDPERKPSWLWVLILFACGGFSGGICSIVAIYLAYKRIKANSQCKRNSDFRRLANIIGDRGTVSAGARRGSSAAQDLLARESEN